MVPTTRVVCLLFFTGCLSAHSRVVTSSSSPKGGDDDIVMASSKSNASSVRPCATELSSGPQMPTLTFLQEAAAIDRPRRVVVRSEVERKLELTRAKLSALRSEKRQVANTYRSLEMQLLVEIDQLSYQHKLYGLHEREMVTGLKFLKRRKVDEGDKPVLEDQRLERMCAKCPNFRDGNSKYCSKHRAQYEEVNNDESDQ